MYRWMDVYTTPLPSLLHYNDDGLETIRSPFSLLAESIRSKKKKKNFRHQFDVETIEGNTINTLYYMAKRCGTPPETLFTLLNNIITCLQR